VVVLPALTALKIELYWALQDAKITRAELMRRLKWNRESVDRLFRLDHASRLDQIEAAFHALGRRVSVRIGKAA
jgi:antitoxin HicB